MTMTEKHETSAKAAQGLLTTDDLLRLGSEGVRGELVRGVLHETMTSGHRHGEIVMNLGVALGNFVKPRRLGSLVASDSGVWLEKDPDTVREPDIAFTSAEKIPPGTIIPGYSEAVPDLVVEIKSPSDSRRYVTGRAEMWLSHGVGLVWVVHPETRSIDVHRPERSVSTIADDGVLDGGDVLPGFTCPLADVFEA